MTCLEFLWLILVTHWVSVTIQPFLPRECCWVQKKWDRKGMMWPKTAKTCLTKTITIPSERCPGSPVRSSRYYSKLKNGLLQNRIKSSSYDPECAIREHKVPVSRQWQKTCPCPTCVCINKYLQILLKLRLEWVPFAPSRNLQEQILCKYLSDLDKCLRSTLAFFHQPAFFLQ